MSDLKKKVDRRIQRTHDLLREALMALIEERGYEPILIQDITDRANVSRTTFYLHFRDKDDLLFTTMEALYDDLVEKIVAPPADGLGPGTRTVVDATEFRHVAAHAKFYRVMVGKHGSGGFVMRVQAYLARVTLEKMLNPLVARGAVSQLPLEFIAQGLAGMEIGLIRWWLEEDNLAHTPEEMALMMCNLSMLGAGWALGLSLTPDMVPAFLLNAFQPAGSGTGI